MSSPPSPCRAPNGLGRTRIKICGLTREADVDAAVEAGADAVGFVMYEKSPRHVTPARAAQLARRLPPFVTPVLLFVNEITSKIVASCDQMTPGLIQFHGDESPQTCATAARACGWAWLRAARIPVDGRFDLLEFAHHYAQAQAILLDAHVEGYGGGGRTFNWSLLPPSVNAHLVLSGGLTPANVTDGILQLRSRGRSLAVDVSSGVEATCPDGKPLKGVKDPQKIRDFVAAVHAADALIHPLPAPR